MVAGKVSLRKMRSNESHLKLGMVADSWNPGMSKAGARGQPGLHSKTLSKKKRNRKRKNNSNPLHTNQRWKAT